MVGGWQTLARKYETTKDIQVDQQFANENGKFGLSRYKFTLTVGFSKRGLFFANNPFFRIGHPPMLIPWSAIRVISADGLFLHIKADETDIWLSKKFFADIRMHL
ncbi:hypothetical protein [Emticicia sp. BO119]|uniref:hypothetical protein n=1 Tax=Emticicia sp. BO119 TaxID=2757768 RepID=UPI0015F07789|nr:hypothetical protein [Emticicia sp. BO119]MBA4850819.1 hypothetical protein [Emticicia sp. BO119]